MFTICFSIFSSLVSVTPVQEVCTAGYYRPDVAAVEAQCRKLDKDPFTTCEARRAGALRWYVTVRQLDGV